MENRARLILEVTATVAQEIGGERTGVPDFASFAYKIAFPVAVPRRNTSISSIDLMFSASPAFTSLKARRVARARSHPSNTDRSAAASAGHISPIMAVTSTLQRRIWSMARQI